MSKDQWCSECEKEFRGNDNDLHCPQCEEVDDLKILSTENKILIDSLKEKADKYDKIKASYDEHRKSQFGMHFLVADIAEILKDE